MSFVSPRVGCFFCGAVKWKLATQKCFGVLPLQTYLRNLHPTVCGLEQEIPTLFIFLAFESQCNPEVLQEVCEN